MCVYLCKMLYLANLSMLYIVFCAGRAAMIGFFMAYLVDSLTGVGLVDQMGNFFCKTLLFIAVVGVLLIRKNEDLENLKKLLDETTFYDKQWQATWQDEKPGSSKNWVVTLLFLSLPLQIQSATSFTYRKIISIFLSISCYCNYSVLVKDDEFKFPSL